MVRCIRVGCGNYGVNHGFCSQCVKEIYTEIKPTSNSDFKKFDQEKPQVAYLPFDQLEEVAKVLDYGAQKYGRDNWHKSPSIMKYLSASLRHIFAWRKGENTDKETGLSHLAHAICSLLFLMWLIENKKEIDDRN